MYFHYGATTCQRDNTYIRTRAYPVRSARTDSVNENLPVLNGLPVEAYVPGYTTTRRRCDKATGSDRIRHRPNIFRTKSAPNYYWTVIVENGHTTSGFRLDSPKQLCTQICTSVADETLTHQKQTRSCNIYCRHRQTF